MKISQKGLYALQAMMTLARRHNQGAIKIWEIAAESDLPEKFLELILLELKNARIVDSVRGARGGYQLRRDPAELPLSEAAASEPNDGITRRSNEYFTSSLVSGVPLVNFSPGRILNV